jgi:hypothetical protein
MLAEFLYQLFRTRDGRGEEIHRTDQHAKYAQHFIQGTGKYTAGMILECWLKSPDGRLSNVSESATDLMYSTASTPYTNIKNVRAALTSFAVQIVHKKLIAEAKQAVKPSSGLHASAKKKATQQVEWSDIGAATVSQVAQIIKKHQPLTWHYMMSIAQPETRGGRETGQRRPASAVSEATLTPLGNISDRSTQVITHAILALNFAHNNEARLLLLARGLLYFAFSAPADLFAYSSRIGEMPAYSTISRALSGLSSHEAKVTLTQAQDPTSVPALQIDNVQNYLGQRDLRIGRENKMNVGIAGIYIEVEDADPAACNLEEKRKLLAENKRALLTVEQLIDMLRQDHLETVFVLQWLRVLTHFIPELAKWKEHVSLLFRTRAARLCLPIRPTKVHPLASSGKNEMVTTELKDAMIDFFAQLGNKPDSYARRLVLVGGDGLTYEKLVQLKRYMQFHEDPFESFEVLEPTLAAWHTEWTDLSRIYETHWDSITSSDPSTLGHSAAVIGQPSPPNLKKVDYYPLAEFLFLVLDVRMLDCWRYIPGSMLK